MIVTCQKCGAHNRVTDSIEPGKRYVCGKCKTSLIDVSQTPKTRKQESATPQTTTAGNNKKPTIVGSVFKKLSWVHPLLFALFPVLYLYSRNLAEVSPSQTVSSLLVSVGFGILIFFLFLLVIAGIQKLRMRSATDIRHEIWAVEKVAIITSVFLILFFNYGDALAISGLDWVGLAITWILLFLFVALLVVRTNRPLQNVRGFLTAVGIILVIIPTINIIEHEVRFGGHDIVTSEATGNENPVVMANETLPDIYYIIPDRYGSETSLEKDFQFDNSDFIDYLTNKGFYVATNSHSNYSRTFASLASSLNMEYINYLTDQLGENFGYNYPMWQLIQDNKVQSFLKAGGYKFINLGDEWDGTWRNANADVNYNLYVQPEFPTLLFRKTLAYPFCWKLGIFEDDRTMHMKNTMYLFDKLAEIPKIEEPTFTFAHLLLPHDPYVFNSDGSYKTLQEEQQSSYRDNYVEQLEFANSKLESLVDTLLTDSRVPPIIIIQADEGPFPVSEPWLGEKATKAGLEIKMGILNAYYLPGVDKDALYPSITPVNSFRLVFNLYFDAGFGLLDDKSYAYDEGYPEKFVYRFLDVTDKLKQN